jgi:hypothetical protein
MRNEHNWKETTADGEKREVRATKFGGAWRFQSKPKREVTWTYHDVPPLEDLHSLHDILFRKYQRKRLPWEDVAAIEKMIIKQGGVPNPDFHREM